MSGPPDIVTIDLEEWFHGHNYLEQVPPDTWDEQELRVERNTERCLEILRRHEVRATFFVLGWTAERCPDLVARIAAAGHEISCHSYGHPLLFRMTEADFRRDLTRARRALQVAGIDQVEGYRAPSFSLTQPVHEFLTVLRDEGFRYDCSLFPVHHPRYGQPAAPRRPFLLRAGTTAAEDGAEYAAEDAAEGLVVVPMTTWRCLGVNVPFAGGGYLRLLPLGVYKFFRDRTLSQKIANVLYLHPWELDDYRPDVGLSRWGRLRSQGGQHSTERKLEAILAMGRFQTLGEYVAELRAAGDLERRQLPLY